MILLRNFDTLVGWKLVMAVTGLGLVGFLLMHLSGNLLVFLGPEALNAYAENLHKLGPLIWMARAGLIGCFGLHVFAGVKLTHHSKAAAGPKYAVSKSVQAKWASKTMALTGLVVLFWLLYHLAHFTMRWTHDFSAYGEYEIYPILIKSFSFWPVSLLYIISISLLMCHLSHGLESVSQTFGLKTKLYEHVFTSLARIVSLVLGLGFISIPLSVMFGLLK
jgi:succinate dehydrogenase / fumarate reductase cytochrome b subunit